MGNGRVVLIPKRTAYWGEHGDQVRGLVVETERQRILPAFVTVNYVGQIERITISIGVVSLFEYLHVSWVHQFVVKVGAFAVK